MKSDELAPKLDRPTDAPRAGKLAPAVTFDLARGLEQLEGRTPTEVMQALVPNIKIEIIAGLLIGVGVDLGIVLPDWAKEASVQFWKYFVGKDFDPLHAPKDLGVLIGLIEGIAKRWPSENTGANGYESWIRSLLPAFLDSVRKGEQDLSPEEAAAYYSGRARSVVVVERVTDASYLKMLKRAPIYLAVALLWERFTPLTSQAEAERWLRSEKVIAEDVDSREVRAAFTVIGLKYRGPGRPKKSENGCAKSKESGFSQSAES